MAAINFPNSPSNNDTHVVDGVTYTYDSTAGKWKTTINSNAFLPLSGGTVSGNILMGGEIQHEGDTDTKIHFDTNEINFDTGGSTRATIDSSGRLGIGTASPATPLTLDGGDLKLTTAASTTRRVFALGGTGNYSLSTSGGAAIAFIRDASDNDSIAFETHVQGSSHAERVRILSGGGITFNGDTAAANALDDYEEGSWTPTISQGVTSPTYTNTTGTYTKIGNCVSFTLRMQCNGGTNAGSQVQIGGLPFTASSTLDEGSGTWGYSSNVGNGITIQLHISSGTSVIKFYHSNGTNWNGNSGNGVVNRTMHIRGFYYV